VSACKQNCVDKDCWRCLACAACLYRRRMGLCYSLSIVFVCLIK
jgi:hypothetical protein